MRFYQASAFLFPRSYRMRIFAICFLSVHLPLLTFIALEVADGNWTWSRIIPLLVATLAGTVIAIACLGGLLAPIEQAARMLRRLQQGEEIEPIPAGAPDIVGELLTSVSMASMETGHRIARLREAANRDPLTGLLNRRGFEDELRQIGPRNSILAMIDLDNFKAINRDHGFQAGDEALHAFANALQEISGPEAVTARWGGDEFTCLCSGTPQAVAEQLEALNGTVSIALAGVGTIPVTFSAGLVRLRNRQRLGEALAAADRAIASIKRAGGRRVDSSGVN